jgi:uroporphyrin-III C-methyltransferase
MRVLRGPLAGLPSLVAREKVKSPALIVIGAVTAQSEQELRALAREVAK